MPVPAPSQLALNNVVWTLSLILQLGLVAVVFARNIARRLPTFTALISFYPLRALLLFGLYGHLDHANYAGLYATLSTIDLLLQAAVVAEILMRVVRELGGWSVTRAGFVLTLLVFTSGCTAMILSRLPEHAPIPVDRGQIFASFFLLSVAVWALTASRVMLLRSVALGLALYSSTSLAAQVGRTVAAARRDPYAYGRWSYLSGAAYLMVVALWLLILRLQPPQPSNAEVGEASVPLHGQQDTL
jgi:hypothetical protein